MQECRELQCGDAGVQEQECRSRGEGMQEQPTALLQESSVSSSAGVHKCSDLPMLCCRRAAVQPCSGAGAAVQDCRSAGAALCSAAGEEQCRCSSAGMQGCRSSPGLSTITPLQSLHSCVPQLFMGAVPVPGPAAPEGVWGLCRRETRGTSVVWGYYYNYQNAFPKK